MNRLELLCLGKNPCIIPEIILYCVTPSFTTFLISESVTEMLMQFLQWAEALTHYQASSTICYLKRYLNSCIFILYVQKMT